MEMVKLTIDGIQVEVPKEHVLEAARAANIQIPTLCYLKESMKSVPAVCVWWK